MHNRICVITKNGININVNGFRVEKIDNLSEVPDIVRCIPSEVESIVYIERDIVFANKNWHKEMQDLLQRCSACQLFETLYLTDDSGRIRRENHSAAFRYVNRKDGGLYDYEYGVAWGFKREIAESGLVEPAFLTQLFCNAEFMTTPDEPTRQWMIKNRKLRGSCGCVRGSVILQENTYSKNHTVRPAKPSFDRVECDVIIPYCKNNERWLKESINSILNQYNADVHLHVIADGFENSYELYETYVDIENFHLYHTESNVGPYRCANKVFPYLKTEYIAIQDSDDISLPHRLSFSINSMSTNKADMFGGAMRQFCSFETKDEESEQYVLEQPVHTSSLVDSWSISPNGIVVNGTRVMTRDLFKRMNGFAPLFMSADCEFTTRCLIYGENVITDGEIVALRRVHGKSLSRGHRFGLKSEIRQKLHDKIGLTYKNMPEEPANKFGNLIADVYDGIICD